MGNFQNESMTNSQKWEKIKLITILYKKSDNKAPFTKLKVINAPQQ